MVKKLGNRGDLFLSEWWRLFLLLHVNDSFTCLQHVGDGDTPLDQ